MSIYVIQKPGDIQASQSPIVFSVGDNTNDVTKDGFQYVAYLYIWSGNIAASGSYLYKYKKYPASIYGNAIFDFHNAIDSTLSEAVVQNPQNFKYYKAEFGYEYISGSTTVTSSLTAVTSSFGCTNFKAYDGYNLFPGEDQDLGEYYSHPEVNIPLSSSCTNFPWMTDMGTVTQSVLLTQNNSINNSPRGLQLWRGASDTQSPTEVVISASYENGTVLTAYGVITSQNNTNTNTQLLTLTSTPGTPGPQGWSGTWPTIPTASLSSYSFQARSGSVTIGKPIHYKVVCEHYYKPVVIAYKNRYGQLDYINFFKRSNKSFQTQTRLYQPQIGNWDGLRLTYEEDQTKYQRYVVDATELLEVNSDWLEEGYNQLIKQMMVSNEIYEVGSSGSDNYNTFLRPLAIQTKDITFKTDINNKLIQYSFVFNYGNPYKLQL